MRAYLERFRAWWSGLAERERRVLAVGAVALGLIVAYAAIWEPLASARQRQQADLRTARRRYFALNWARGALVWAAFGCFLAATYLEWR